MSESGNSICLSSVWQKFNHQSYHLPLPRAVVRNTARAQMEALQYMDVGCGHLNCSAKCAHRHEAVGEIIAWNTHIHCSNGWGWSLCLLPVHLPANVPSCEVTGDSTHIRVPATHSGHPDGVPGSWLSPGQATAWQFLSLSVCFSLPLPFK